MSNGAEHQYPCYECGRMIFRFASEDVCPHCGVPIVPLGILSGVADERLRRLTNQVWRRLPEHDRHVLQELLCDISDTMSSPMGERALGIATVVPPDTWVSGCAAQMVEDLSYIVGLAGAKEIESDDACMFVIAHEFAHVVLRHLQMTVLTVSLLGFDIYTKDDLQTLSDWHEEHADLQAWLWGFGDEFEEFLDAYPKARRSRWHVELQTG